MHWCADESLALMSSVPIIGYCFRKLHAWYHIKSAHRCHERSDCQQVHAEHVDAQQAHTFPSVDENPLWMVAGFQSEEEWDTYIILHPDIEVFP